MIMQADTENFYAKYIRPGIVEQPLWENQNRAVLLFSDF
jgi:hypothetical protein